MTEGLLFALLATLSWSICIFPFTTAARRIGNNELNHFRLIVATVILALLCLVINAEMFTGLFRAKMITPWIWFGISGIIGLTIGDYFAVRMYSILGARTGSVLTTFAPAGALIAGGSILAAHLFVLWLLLRWARASYFPLSDIATRRRRSSPRSIPRASTRGIVSISGSAISA